ncbi:MAG: 4Fe-4S binding protein, partial [Clostridiaceae bacterium]
MNLKEQYDYNMSICNHCGACVKLCPMNAIKEDTLEISEDKCIRCFSCVKRCPRRARKIIYGPKHLVCKVLKAKSKIKRSPKI